MKHLLILTLCLFVGLYSFADPCDADSFKVKIIANANTICPGQPVELLANVEGGLPGFAHKWSTGDTGIAITTTLTETTAITLEVYSKGCDKTIMATDTILVVDVSAAFKILDDTIKASVPFGVELNGSFDDLTINYFDASSNDLKYVDYVRSGSTSNVVNAPHNSGNYLMVAIAKKGLCYDTSKANISIQFSDIMFVPTAIRTSSGVSANTIFRSYSPVDYTNYSLQIFSPSGQCLYECFTQGCSWNASEVEDCRSQKYLYVISYDDDEGNPIVRKGYFVLLN